MPIARLLPRAFVIEGGQPATPAARECGRAQRSRHDCRQLGTRLHSSAVTEDQSSNTIRKAPCWLLVAQVSNLRFRQTRQLGNLRHQQCQAGVLALQIHSDAASGKGDEIRVEAIGSEELAWRNFCWCWSRFLFGGCGGEIGIDGSCLGRVNAVIVRIGLGQLVLAHEQGVEAFPTT